LAVSAVATSLDADSYGRISESSLERIYAKATHMTGEYNNSIDSFGGKDSLCDGRADVASTNDSKVLEAGHIYVLVRKKAEQSVGMPELTECSAGVIYSTPRSDLYSVLSHW
jgi:hypothetical protein